MTRRVACKPPGQGESPVTRQVPAGSSNKPPSPAGLHFRPVYTAGYIPDTYLKLKMPGPRGVITVNGNTERSLRTEEHTAALATEVQSSLYSPAIKCPDTVKRAQSNLQQDLLARSEQV